VNHVFTALTLRGYVARTLVTAGLPPADADVVAESLVYANLRGVDSHGVTRVPIYVERLRRGIVRARPEIDIVSESGGALLVDGGNGMGAVVMSRALDIALERLPTARSLSVAVRNSNHYGSGAFYAAHAASKGAAMFLYGNAPATMAAWGGTSRLLGTNPYTFAVPMARDESLVLDMATSVVARGKIILAAQRDEEIPLGWAIDHNGTPTTAAKQALAGSVLPFGGPKGYGIALMVEVMAGVLAGAQVGPEIGDLYDELERPQGVGAFFSLIDISTFMPLETFTRRIESLIEQLKATGSTEPGGEVLFPGEIEARTSRRRAHEGIPLPDHVVASLDELAPDDAAPLSHLGADTTSV
jgi:LDH2 family malate/lactate/ureidoglycolate dehydrogenase